jgi:hypothetical protein
MASAETIAQPSVFNKIFNLTAAGVMLYVGGELLSNAIMDPLFFDVIHDVSNEIGQAWKLMVTDWLGWMPYHMGLKGEGGLLYPLTSFILSPYMDSVAIPDASDFGSAGLSIDDLMSP